MKFLEIYYEIFLTDGEKCTCHTFENLDDAIEYAEKINAKTIQTVGGDYAEYEKCEFCGDWFDTYELNSENYCDRCQCAIRDHGFYTPNDRKGR